MTLKNINKERDSNGVLLKIGYKVEIAHFDEFGKLDSIDPTQYEIEGFNRFGGVYLKYSSGNIQWGENLIVID